MIDPILPVARLPFATRAELISVSSKHFSGCRGKRGQQAALLSNIIKQKTNAMELLFRDEFMLLTSLSGASMVYWCKDPQSPPKILSTQCPSEKKVDSEARGVVLAATFSQSKYLALCTDFKQLLLYKTSKSE